MNITLGRYVNINSWFHKVNPIIKMVSIILLIVSLFLIPVKENMLNIDILLGFSLVFIILIQSAKLNIILILKGIKPILYLLLLTFIMQILLDKNIKSESVLGLRFNFSVLTILFLIAIFFLYNFTKKKIKFSFLYFVTVLVFTFLYLYYVDYKTFSLYEFFVTKKAIYRSIFLFLRVCNVFLLTSLLTATTSNASINYGLSGLMYPLKLFRFPVHVISMMISLTFRFIPTLYDESTKIFKAQSARGLDFNEINFFKKISQIVSFLIPLFVLSFQKAEDMANAMEIRGYVVGQKRSSVDRFRVRIVDIFFFIFCILVCLFSITYLVLVKKGVLK